MNISKEAILFMAIESALDYKRAKASAAMEHAGQTYEALVVKYGADRAAQVWELIQPEQSSKTGTTANEGLVMLSKFESAAALDKALDQAFINACCASLNRPGFDFGECKRSVSRLYWGTESWRSHLISCIADAKCCLTAQQAYDLQSEVTTYADRTVSYNELTQKMIDHEGFIEKALAVLPMFYSTLRSFQELPGGIAVRVPNELDGRWNVKPPLAVYGTFWAHDGTRHDCENIADIDQIVSDRTRAMIDRQNLSESKSDRWND